MTTETKVAHSPHSPLPWQEAFEGHVFSGNRLVAGCFGHSSNVEDVMPENIANADFIVRACNAHDELLAALKAFADGECHCDETPDDHKPCVQCMAHNAIAKAEGK